MIAAFEPLWYWLADSYAVATCVLLAAAAVAAFLEQPARRLFVSRSALVGLLVLLVLSAVPSWPRTGLRPAPAPVVEQRPQRLRTTTTPAIARAILERPAAGRPRAEVVAAPMAIDTPPAPARAHTGAPAPVEPRAANTPARDWTRLAGQAFLAGAGLMLAWLALGSWQTNVLRRRARRAPGPAAAVLRRVVGKDGRMPELLVGESLRQPVAVGVLRPAILLPARFVDDEPEERLEAVLAHEWAHIENRDLWLIALLRLLLPVLYAHPAYWWLRRQVRDDQEALADARAAGAQGRLSYAEVLLSWSRIAPESPRFAAGGSLALFERPSQIKWRIIMLLDRTFQVEPSCPARWRLAVRAAMVPAIVGLSLLTLRPVAAGEDPAPAAARTDDGDAKTKTNRNTETKTNTNRSTKTNTNTTNDANAGAEADHTVRVVDPDGKPFGGAAVYLSTAESYDFRHRPTTPRRLGTTRPDGSFESPPKETGVGHSSGTVVIMADGYGPAFGNSHRAEDARRPKLVKDDVPIRGRVLDIQGRAVAGATVQVVALLWHPSGSLDEWLQALKTRKAAYPVQYEMLRWWSNDDVPTLYPPVTTDKEGRFTLKGIGRERIASLLVSGPAIETMFEFVATRPMPTLKVPDFERQDNGSQVTYYGAEFDLVAGPGLEAAGMVTDKDTGKPLSGVVVQTAALFGNPLRTLNTTTDARGRYRLPGIPAKTKFGDSQDLLVNVDDGTPYLPAVKPVKPGDGVKPVTIDFQLKRGVWARGRVIDGSTGKGVRASLEYYILEDNPYLKTYPRYGTVRASMPNHTEDDGTFRLIVMPGRGILGARAGNDHYRLGAGLEKIEGLKPQDGGGLEMIRARPHYLIPTNYHTVVGLDPKEGDESVSCEITLDRGRTVKGTILDPDGKPLTGARIEGIEDHFRTWSPAPLPSAEFEVHALGKGQSRLLLFWHEARKLAGAYLIKDDNDDAITVKLEPAGAVTGRLVDSGGLPMAETQMTCNVPHSKTADQAGSLPSPIKTGIDGRFRAEGLVPGRKYTFHAWRTHNGNPNRPRTTEAVKDAIATRGETKDLGDVTVKWND